MVNNREVRIVPLLLCFCLAFALIMVPSPEGINPKGWYLFAIFVASIFAIVSKSLPIGSVSILAIGSTLLTNALTVEEVLSGFSKPTIWLVVIAFFISRGFIKTGLGIRIAYLFTALIGRNTLGLAYGLVCIDFVMAPVILSSTARAGGIVYPILKSLALTYKSYPEENSRKRVGAFLTQTAYQANIITSAMFATAMAANPLIMNIAEEMGIDISWGSWALAASLPGIVSLIVVPYFLYKIYPPEVKEALGVSKTAWENLAEMGKIKRDEWIMCAVFVFLLVLWGGGKQIANIHITATAFFALGILLITGVLTWEDIRNEKGAWDALIWLSTLVTIASFLGKLDVIHWWIAIMGAYVQQMSWKEAFPVLIVLYFYSHYFFAGNTAHISAMYASFLGLGIALGVPSMLMALTLAFSSSLFAGLTHYGTGPAPIFFESRYVPLSEWWGIGLLVSFVNLGIWIGVGGLWWKFIGIW